MMLVAWAGGAPVRGAEPKNLFPLKQEIRAYVESGEYLRGVAAVAAEADAWIEERVRTQTGKAGASRENLAIVFDLDETLFCNLPSLLQQDFGYVPEVWDAWVQRAEAPPLEPVRHVYETARRLQVAVFFLSSRPERDRAATEKNLRAMGCGECEALILRPDGLRETSGRFKRDERRRLVSKNFLLIANIGDQESDFLGGGAERNFKIPNPFYISE